MIHCFFYFCLILMFIALILGILALIVLLIDLTIVAVTDGKTTLIDIIKKLYKKKK